MRAVIEPGIERVGVLDLETFDVAAQVFLLARVVYVIVYIAGIPWVRTIAFVVSLLATLILYSLAL